MAIIRDYDEMYLHEQLRRVELQQADIQDSINGAEATSSKKHEKEISVAVSAFEISHAQMVSEELRAERQVDDADSEGVDDAAEVVTGDNIVFVGQSADKIVIYEDELPEVMFEQPVVEAEPHFSAIELGPIEILQTFTSEFTEDEAADIDKEIGIEPLGHNNSEAFVLLQENAEKAIDKEEDFAQAVHGAIEAISTENVAEAQEASQELETIRQLTSELIAVLSVPEANPEQVEAIKERLYVHAEQLLGILGKSTDVKVVRRFVERMITSELRIAIETAKLRAEKRGTHENKHFLDDLKWIGDAGRDVVRLVGNLVLSKANIMMTI